jgi:HPr kinase/phosphorylase
MGEARVGKSECALELLSRGHAIVADDVVLLEREGDSIIGSSPEMFRGLLEIRDLGIIDVQKIFGKDSVISSKPIDFVIELVKDIAPSTDGSLSIGGETIDICGVSFRRVALRVSRGRNLAVLIETAVKMLADGDNTAVETLLVTHRERMSAV